MQSLPIDKERTSANVIVESEDVLPNDAFSTEKWVEQIEINRLRLYFIMSLSTTAIEQLRSYICA